MSKIIKLAKVSEPFAARIAQGPVKERELIPCPRCGADPARIRRPAPSGGFFAKGFNLFALPFALILYSPFLIPLSLFMKVDPVSVLLGTYYRCKQCGFRWTARDIVSYRKSRVQG